MTTPGVRLVVVGAGSHSESCHGPSLRDLARQQRGSLILAAVCDLDRDKASNYAREFDFDSVYTDMHEMIEAENPGAIVAVTPLDATRAVVGDLLPYGIPILLEKPPGRNPAEAREILEAARAHGTSTMVSLNRRFIPAVHTAREWLERHGTGGGPRLLVARMLRAHRREEDFITGTAIHVVDTVLSFMGTPSGVTHHRWATPLGGQSCDACLEFSDGSSALIAIAPDCGVEEETYEIIGPDYRAFVDAGRSRVEITRSQTREIPWAEGEDAPRHVMGGCLRETEAFLSAVRGEIPFRPTLEEAVASLEVTYRLDGPTGRGSGAAS